MIQMFVKSIYRPRMVNHEFLIKYLTPDYAISISGDEVKIFGDVWALEGHSWYFLWR